MSPWCACDIIPAGRGTYSCRENTETYYDALQIAIASGDQARPRDFAETAYAARVVLEGEDNPEAIGLKRLAERPTDHRLYGMLMRWKQAAKKVPQGLSEGNLG